MDDLYYRRSAEMIYRLAAETIRRTGWVKGRWSAPPRRHCAAAAIFSSSEGLVDAQTAVRLVSNFGRTLVGETEHLSDDALFLRVVAWNDSCDTGEDVAIRLEAEADRLESEEVGLVADELVPVV